ncbi:MAG: hypothetical protein ACK4N5_25230, partial [Myxococcales bacterium]
TAITRAVGSGVRTIEHGNFLDEASARVMAERGAILVAAVFDAFFEVYAHATRDLFRIAGRLPQQGEELQTDLALRLAKDAASIASGFLRLCIQALEYCPPVDL